MSCTNNILVKIVTVWVTSGDLYEKKTTQNNNNNNNNNNKQTKKKKKHLPFR